MPQRDTRHQALKQRPAGGNTGSTPESVLAEARKSGVEISTEKAAELHTYLDILIKYNKRMNLVGPSDWKTIMRTLIVDSLYIAPFLAEQNFPDDLLTLDLGAGAGLPGIPLRVLWTTGRYVLVEPREKRAVFMGTALSRMKLTGTEVFRGRAQELPENCVPADLILSRAFMPRPDFLALARTLLKPGGSALVLSNEPMPTKEVLEAEAPGWTPGPVLEYPAAGTVRYALFFLVSSSMSM